MELNIQAMSGDERYEPVTDKIIGIYKRYSDENIVVYRQSNGCCYAIPIVSVLASLSCRETVKYEDIAELHNKELRKFFGENKDSIVEYNETVKIIREMIKDARKIHKDNRIRQTIRGEIARYCRGPLCTLVSCTQLADKIILNNEIQVDTRTLMVDIINNLYKKSNRAVLIESLNNASAVKIIQGDIDRRQEIVPIHKLLVMVLKDYFKLAVYSGTPDVVKNILANKVDYILSLRDKILFSLLIAEIRDIIQENQLNMQIMETRERCWI